MNMFSLEGKNAWITGASYGIGFNIAKAFAGAGIKNIIFNDINEEALAKGLANYKEAGIENEYIFGHTVEQINAAKGDYYARGIYDINDRLRRAINTLVDGTVPTDDEQRGLFHALLDGASWHKADHYFLLLDYASYMDAKLQANADYADRLAFGRKCLMNIASGAKFSSDRTIRQYAKEIWHVQPTQF